MKVELLRETGGDRKYYMTMENRRNAAAGTNGGPDPDLALKQTPLSPHAHTHFQFRS
jgi:hypothetical protein